MLTTSTDHVICENIEIFDKFFKLMTFGGYFAQEMHHSNLPEFCQTCNEIFGLGQKWPGQTIA